MPGAVREARAAISHTSQPSTTAGRIVATVSTLEGTVYLSGVPVELRTASDPTVLARTLTDGTGVVPFPAVRPRRYLVNACRAGFISGDPGEVQVTANQTA